MAKKKKNQAPRTSWKRIPQKAGKQSITKESQIVRWRRLFRFATISLGTGSVVLGLSLLGYYFINTPKASAIHAATASFVNLDIETDGVLPPSWIEFRMGLEQNLGLMQIDMSGLKATLERFPQIKEASIEREFPITLRVRVRERFPIFRMKVKVENVDSQILLVDEEGFVFRNIKFPDHMINRLPFLAKVVLLRNGSGYHPISSVPCVAELCHVARQDFPELAREWMVVYLDQLIMAQTFTKGYIRVMSRGVEEILFGPENFGKQLENLQYILDRHGGPSVSSISRVNLSLLDQPTVEFDNNSYPNSFY
jgi:hypothetical protein